jgi:hypothetical protein
VPLGIPLQAFLYSHSYLLNVTIQFANKTGVLKKIRNNTQAELQPINSYDKKYECKIGQMQIAEG